MSELNQLMNLLDEDLYDPDSVEASDTRFDRFIDAAELAPACIDELDAAASVPTGLAGVLEFLLSWRESLFGPIEDDDLLGDPSRNLQLLLDHIKELGGNEEEDELLSQGWAAASTGFKSDLDRLQGLLELLSLSDEDQREKALTGYYKAMGYDYISPLMQAFGSWRYEPESEEADLLISLGHRLHEIGLETLRDDILQDNFAEELEEISKQRERDDPALDSLVKDRLY